jgi:hypothetical protein
MLKGIRKPTPRALEANMKKNKKSSNDKKTIKREKARKFNDLQMDFELAGIELNYLNTLLDESIERQNDMRDAWFSDEIGPESEEIRQFTEDLGQEVLMECEMGGMRNAKREVVLGLAARILKHDKGADVLETLSKDF